MSRSKWNAGPWDNEPDKDEWVDGATGYRCFARRHDRLGHWCGYVAVPLDHPLYACGDGAMPDSVETAAHCGVTWADFHNLFDRYLIGFDCGHAWDYSPGLPVDMSSYGDSTYRDLPYVKGRVRMLAAALHEVETEAVTDAQNAEASS